MVTITPANLAYKDKDGDLGEVKSLTGTDVTLLNNALQDIENLKLAIQNPSPTGMVALWDDTNIPEGWLLCNGAAVSRSTYATLFVKLGTRHGAGDGSTTFNLPDFRDRYPIGVGTNVLGTQVAEQLPNIIGKNVWPSYAQTSVPHDFISGAFKDEGASGFGSTSGTSGGASVPYYSFDASRSNAIYTDNGKVYPASIALNFIIKT